MRGLLIVDDERNIREGLKAMIDREFPGAFRIALAADGAEALALQAESPADIVITDIRMPNMDGLALIRTMAAAGEDPRMRDREPVFIILSGYDDFRYAKEAIKYRVKEYLLKPIVRDELFEALRRAERELEERRRLAERLEATGRYMATAKESTLGYLFAAAGIGAEEAARRCREAGLAALEPAYHVGVLNGRSDHRAVAISKDWLRQRTAAGDPSRPDADGPITVCLEDMEGHLVVATGDAALFRDWCDRLQAAGVGPFAIGVSSRGESLADLRRKYEEAKRAVRHALLIGPSAALIRQEDIASRRRDVPVPVETIRKLANMMGTEREREMKAALHALFAPEVLERADIGYVEEAARLLNEMVFDQVFRTYGEASVEIIRLYRKAANPHLFESIADYLRCAEGLLTGLNEYVRRLRSVHVDHPEMARAVAYIREHYARNLNMAMVANYVSLNYSYFSERFKAWTGDSFVNYLKKVRIEKAKELLAQTDDKVHEIGRRVGFSNPKQFNRVFREVEGITALEYRRKAQAEQRNGQGGPGSGKDQTAG